MSLSTGAPVASSDDPEKPLPADGGSAAAARVLAWQTRTAGFLVAVVGVSGLAASTAVERQGLSGTSPELSGNVFHRLCVLFEGPFLWLLVVTGLLTVLWPLVPRIASAREKNPWSLSSRAFGGLVALLSVAVLVGTLVGFRAVMHGRPLSADEFATMFQARIFARGEVEAKLAPAWQHFGFALTPIWINYDRLAQTWKSTYLPVDSAFRAGILRLGLDAAAANTAVAAATLLLLAAAVRRLRPERNGLALLAVVFLAASSQFLITSMTAYAMPLELFFNLLWLLLYLRGDRTSWIALPWVGVLALGVHNPFPHALFVAPFLLRWLWKRRGAWLAYVAAVYALGVVFWWSYLRHANLYGRGGAFFSLFSDPRPADLVLQLMHLALAFSWQAPLVAVLFVVGALSYRSLPEAARDLAVGVALTFLFYCLFPAGQGHGWGYRYVYGVFGNLVILAVFGAERLASCFRFVAFPIATSLAIAVGWQIPRRVSDVESFVAPFARAQAYVASLQGAVVLIDPAIGWYACDLIRNDPFLENDPKVLFANKLAPVRRVELDSRFAGLEHNLSWEELDRLGFPGASPPGAASRTCPPSLKSDAIVPGRVRWIPFAPPRP